MLVLIQHKRKLGAVGYYEIEYKEARQTILLRTIMIGLHEF